MCTHRLCTHTPERWQKTKRIDVVARLLNRMCECVVLTLSWLKDVSDHLILFGIAENMNNAPIRFNIRNNK